MNCSSPISRSTPLRPARHSGHTFDFPGQSDWHATRMYQLKNKSASSACQTLSLTSSVCEACSLSHCSHQGDLSSDRSSLRAGTCALLACLPSARFSLSTSVPSHSFESNVSFHRFAVPHRTICSVTISLRNSWPGLAAAAVWRWLLTRRPRTRSASVRPARAWSPNASSRRCHGRHSPPQLWSRGLVIGEHRFTSSSMTRPNMPQTAGVLTWLVGKHAVSCAKGR